MGWLGCPPAGGAVLCQASTASRAHPGLISHIRAFFFQAFSFLSLVFNIIFLPFPYSLASASPEGWLSSARSTGRDAWARDFVSHGEGITTRFAEGLCFIGGEGRGMKGRGWYITWGQHPGLSPIPEPPLGALYCHRWPPAMPCRWVGTPCGHPLLPSRCLPGHLRQP